MTSRRGRTSFLKAPVSGWAWRSTAHLMLGFPISIVTFAVTLVLVGFRLVGRDFLLRRTAT